MIASASRQGAIFFYKSCSTHTHSDTNLRHTAWNFRSGISVLDGRLGSHATLRGGSSSKFRARPLAPMITGYLHMGLPKHHTKHQTTQHAVNTLLTSQPASLCTHHCPCIPNAVKQRRWELPLPLGETMQQDDGHDEHIHGIAGLGQHTTCVASSSWQIERAQHRQLPSAEFE